MNWDTYSYIRLLGDPSSLTLNVFKDRAPTTGQPVSVPHHAHCKRLFPYIQPKSTLFKLEAISPSSTNIGPFFPVAPL